MSEPGRPPAPRFGRILAGRGGPFAGYSRFVAVMKVLLPALATALLVLLLLWPKLTLVESGFRVGFAKLSMKEVETLSMNNARYFGISESNRPYAVSADTAVQEPGRNDLIHLRAPKADFASTSGANIMMEAESGEFDQTMKILDLSRRVSLYHDHGYELHTESARIDLAHNSARGFDPVQGHGPQGQVESEGFEIVDHGRRITFTGKAHLTLRAAPAPGRRAPAAKATGAARR